MRLIIDGTNNSLDEGIKKITNVGKNTFRALVYVRDTPALSDSKKYFAQFRVASLAELIQEYSLTRDSKIKKLAHTFEPYKIEDKIIFKPQRLEMKNTGWFYDECSNDKIYGFGGSCKVCICEITYTIYQKAKK